MVSLLFLCLIILQTLFIAQVVAQLSLGTCSLQCDQSTAVFSVSRSNRSRGPPGKRGPPGLRGVKGERGAPAAQCECNGMNELSAVVQQYRNLVDSIQNATFPPSCRYVPSKPLWQKPVYTIFPFGNTNQGIEVACDVNTDGGGWMIIQRRIDGSEDFYRNWNDYVTGFGKITSEYWIGLDTIYNLTNSGNYELRVDMEDFQGNTAYAKYSNFRLSDRTFYTARISGYSGTAGNSMEMNGLKFTTKDRDHDTANNVNCAVAYSGAWWHAACHAANPNGHYYTAGQSPNRARGIIWATWKDWFESMKTIEMKIRLK
ncbi:microfibril-associated glycoprotein 4 isoform X1 [Ciona intestinalis]